jgi:CheY-like chemotaxis protein
VENGRDVLNAISSTRPDAVVLDIGLPDVDGSTVYRQIAEQHPLLPVVFSSGHADQAKLEAHLSRPNVALLRKPYEIHALLATLESVIR